jgi:hypothetical protein
VQQARGPADGAGQHDGVEDFDVLDAHGGFAARKYRARAWVAPHANCCTGMRLSHGVVVIGLMRLRWPFAFVPMG